MLIETRRLSKKAAKLFGVVQPEIASRPRPQHRDIVYCQRTKKFYVDYRDRETGFHHTVLILTPKCFAASYDLGEVALSNPDPITRFMAGILLGGRGSGTRKGGIR